MATKVIDNKQSTYGGPSAFYSLSISTSNRRQTAVAVNYTLTAALQYSDSHTAYQHVAVIKVGGVSRSVTINAANVTWSGNGTKTFTGSFDVTGLTATTSSLATSLAVTSSAGNVGGVLSTTTGKSVTISQYATASVPTVSGDATTGGAAVTIYTNRVASTLTHTLEISLGEFQQTKTGVGASTTFSVPAEWANAIQDAATAKATIKCTTFSGSTTIGTKSVTMNVNVNPDAAPTINSATYAEASVTPFSTFTANISSLAVNITASGKYGANISNYALVVGDETYASDVPTFTTAILNAPGTMTVYAQVTDNRGFIANYDLGTISVLDYQEPTVSATASGAGTVLTINASGSYSAVGGENVATGVAVVDGVDSYPFAIGDENYAVIITASVAPGTAHSVIVTVTDRYTSAEATALNGQVCISKRSGGRGVALFKDAVRDGFDVAGDTYISGDTRIDGALYVGGTQMISAANYVVEEGAGNVSNSFYRKWSDGTLETWRKISVAPTFNSTIISGIRYTSGTTDYNYGAAFIDVPPVVVATPQVADTTAYLIGTIVKNITATAVRFNHFRLTTNTGSVSYNISLYAKGRYK